MNYIEHISGVELKKNQSKSKFVFYSFYPLPFILTVHLK